jgi:hypothetical protein
MGKKIVAILILISSLYGNAIAQNDSAKGFVHKGLLRAALTYSVGRMSTNTVSNVYVTGNMEYYADSKISVRGDGYYFVNSLNDSKFLKLNHQLYFGACYNFPVRSRFNPFIGIQPGIAYTQLNTDIIQINTTYTISDPATFSPLASAVIGLNYYAERWFHILLNVRYTVGRHLDEVALFDLNELSFSFGLGWNLNTIKSK